MNKTETEKDLESLHAQVEKGFELAYEKLLKFKKEKNSPLIISRNGKVVAVSVEELTKKSNEL